MMRVAAVLLGAVAVVAAYALAFLPGGSAAAPWVLCGGMAVLLPSLLWLGIAPGSRSGRRARLAIVIVLGVVLLGGLGGALLPAGAGDQVLFLGLPRRAALLIYGVGLLPGLGFGVVYAIGFDRLVLDRSRLEELRKELTQDRDSGLS